VKIQQNFSRVASPNELMYKEIQKTYTTLSMQFIIKGSGNIDKNHLKKAVEKASEACPFSRAILKKNKWLDTSKPPTITYLKNFKMNEKNFDNELFKMKIDPCKESPVHIYVSNATKFVIIIRIFHGLMDGKGAFIFIDNIFKNLRNESLVEAFSCENDESFTKQLTSKRTRLSIRPCCELINPRGDSSKAEVYFERLEIEGYQTSMVTKLSNIISKHFKERVCNFMIPFNLRVHNSSLQCTSNLTIPIFLKTTNTDTFESIKKNLLTQIMTKKHLNLENVDHGLLKFIPSKYKKLGICFANYYSKKTNKYLISGIISDMGKINLENLSTNTFNATSLYILPTQQPFFPILANVFYSGGKTQIIISSSKCIMSKDRFLEIINDICSNFDIKQVLD
jgi:hypothetical protein